MANEAAPNVRTLETTLPAAGAAVDQDQTIGEVPVAGTVTEVAIYLEAAITAHAANFRTFQVVNKGADGNGTVVVASFATDTVTDDDVADFDEKLLTLSVVAGATTVAAGDVLAAVETHASSGVAHSGYKIKVSISRVAGS